jgi:hypothetical protein
VQNNDIIMYSVKTFYRPLHLHSSGDHYPIQRLL